MLIRRGQYGSRDELDAGDAERLIRVYIYMSIMYTT